MIFTPAARVATSSYPSVSTTIGAQPYTPLALIAIIMHNISRYTCLDKQYDNGCFDASYHGRAIGGIAGGAAGPTHQAHGCVWLRATQGGLRACMHACMRGVEHTIATCILCREYQLKTLSHPTPIKPNQCPDNVWSSPRRSCTAYLPSTICTNPPTLTTPTYFQD